MIKIFFDHQIFSLQKYGGISRYFSNLIAAKKFSSITPIIYTNNAYLSNRKTIRDNKISLHIPGANTLNYFRNQYYSLLTKCFAEYDIYHPTYYDPALSFLNKNSTVVTVYDMIHEIFKDEIAWYDPTRFLKSVLINRATHIIAISNSTKNDLIRLLSVPAEKISVVYLSTDFSISKRPLSRFSISNESYLLYVGIRSGYKNFHNFLLACAPILKQYDGMKLMCIGGGIFTTAESYTIKSLKLENKVTFKHAGEPELKAAYQNALLFIYPSKYEGFGIPVLESFSQGCPVVCSNTSSLPEVAGEAAVFFDPYSVEDMRAKILKLIQSQSLRIRLSKLGYKQLGKFSWRKTISDTNDVYEKVLALR